MNNDKMHESDEAYGRFRHARHRFRNRDRTSGGVMLLLIGCALLARQLGAPLPNWLFTWPMILIVVGLFMGLKLRFRNPAWLVPTFLGAVFLADQFLGMNLKPLVFPIVIIAMGLLFLFRPHGHRGWRHGLEREETALPDAADTTAFATDRSDFIDSTAVFGGVKKIVLSKNFKGGDITNFMGGSEINLTQADFNGRVRIDTTNVFGGTKLIVPPHWDVQSDVVAVFGGVDDKRSLNGVALDPNKVVVLDGTCVFGGIEISSY
jgi:predicted membrane protein